jgi:hypothetical protein
MVVRFAVAEFVCHVVVAVVSGPVFDDVIRGQELGFAGAAGPAFGFAPPQDFADGAAPTASVFRGH